MRNLKTALLFIFLAVFASESLFSQNTFVTFNAGYGINSSSSNIDEFTNFTYRDNSITREQINISLGKGLNVGVGIGHMFNKNVGAELGISYLFGSENEAKSVFVDMDSETNFTISSNMLRINPALRIDAGLEGFSPYAKFGLIVGIGSINYELEDIDDKAITKFKYDGGVGLGLNAGIGANFSISESITFFAEINMVNMSYAPTKGELTEYTYNGVDLLSEFSTYDKEIEFVDKYTSDFSTPPSESEPSKSLKQKFPYGSVGLNVGVKINIGRGESELK